jgi:HAD superfamily hydrolase (TIGR01484 family)
VIDDILLCSDLDRTILPNGPQDESPQARPRLRSLAAQARVVIAYVSGRHQGLLKEAIREYAIPVPSYAIGDVGTTVYEISGDKWHPWPAWAEEIAPDWQGLQATELNGLLRDIDSLTLQEPDKQNTYKLSYYAPEDIDRRILLDRVGGRLDRYGVRASIIWSIDELKGTGLLDVLPEHATKLHAIQFLMERKGFASERTVFAGDSGNDLPALTSGLQSVLVKNAREDVRREALARVEESGQRTRLHLAEGGFLGMNGNYAAGVLEGLAHFLPETAKWMC